jgi:hypothetical protein
LIRDYLANIDENILIADGFDDALIGYVELFGIPRIALYDSNKCIQILVENLGITAESAEEHFRFNVLGACMGEYTPAFATILKEADVNDEN